MVYVGSKSRLAPIFVPMFNNLIKDLNINTYIEPFVGGANIFDKIICENKYGYDKSKTLIALFNQGLNDIDVIPEEGSRAWWDKAKAEYKGEIPQTLEDWEIGAIQFFASFGTRGFPGGYANNKHNKDYYNERYRNFKKQIELLKQTGGVFINKSYMDIEVPDGSLIYCDPPYMGTKPYGYAFENDFNHSDYWNWVRNISKNNYVICSEEQCPEDFEIVWNGELTRLVHSDNNYKGNEILCIYDDGLLKNDMLK